MCQPYKEIRTVRTLRTEANSESFEGSANFEVPRRIELCKLEPQLRELHRKRETQELRDTREMRELHELSDR